MSEIENTARPPFTEQDVEAILLAMSSGESPAEAAGVDQERLEALYALGHRLYTVGEYKDAETAFRSLCLYDYRDGRFWMGLGASLQAQDRFAMAAEVYGMAGLATLLADPAPFYYAGLCHLKLGDLESADAALAAVEHLGTPGDSKDDPVKAKAAKLRTVIKASLASGGAAAAAGGAAK